MDSAKNKFCWKNTDKTNQEVVNVSDVTTHWQKQVDSKLARGITYLPYTAASMRCTDMKPEQSMHDHNQTESPIGEGSKSETTINRNQCVHPYAPNALRAHQHNLAITNNSHVNCSQSEIAQALPIANQLLLSQPCTQTYCDVSEQSRQAAMMLSMWPVVAGGHTASALAVATASGCYQRYADHVLK